MKAALGDFLTDAQLEKCLALYPDHNAIRDQVIAPNMEEINRKLGQENDPKYLAYMVVAGIDQAARQKAMS